MTTLVHSGAVCAARPQNDLWARVMTAIELRKSRKALGKLELHLLNDIGVTQKDAKIEANRSTWDAPSHWMR